MKRNLLYILLLLNIILNVERKTFAFNQKIFQEKYISTKWDFTNGLPVNNALDIVQGEDGYIWIGTYDGLLRYDGKEFKTYNKYTNENINCISAIELFSDSKKRVWIGTNESGVTILNKEGYSSLSMEDGISSNIVNNIVEDSGGKIWLGTSNGIDCLTFNEKYNTWKIDNIVKDAYVEHLEALENGKVTALINTGEILIFNGFKQEKLDLPQDLISFKFHSILQDSESNLWLGTNSGEIFKILPNMTFLEYKLENITYVSNLQEVDSFEGEKRVVFSSDDGFGMFDEGKNKFIVFKEEDGIINNSIEKVLVDKEENLWLVSKRVGVQKFTKNIFSRFSSDMGLVDNIVNVIEQDSAGNYWIGTNKGLSILDSGEFINNKYVDYFSSIRIRHILRDSKERIWLGTYSQLGLVKISNGKITSINSDAGLTYNKVRVTFEDSKGRIWIGTTSGLNLIENPDEEKLSIFNEFMNLPKQYFMCIAEDKDGNIWLGSDGNGVYVLDKDKKVKQILKKDGLAGNVIFKILCDDDGNIWITTNEGITLFKDGRYHNFRKNSGIYSDVNYQMLLSKDKFWLTNSKGVYSVKKSEFIKNFNSNEHKIDLEFYNMESGYPGSSTSTSWGLIDSEAKLWFPTLKGVASLDEADIKIKDGAVKVVIDYIDLDGKKYKPYELKVIPPDIKRIKIKYNALSYRFPGKIKFKYYLEGFETRWSDETFEREATYTNLPAGKLKFNVIASNDSGIFNKEAVSFTFHKKPFFYKRNSFLALLILLLLLIFNYIKNIRLKNVKNQKALLEKEVKERTKDLNAMALSHQRKNLELTESIEYAEKIQKGILTDVNLIKENFEDLFLIYIPRDMVSGDFYWYTKRENNIYIAVADCTGHGVPGALLMSMCHMLLDRNVSQFNFFGLAKTLEKINSELKIILGRNSSEWSGNIKPGNGMDLSICKINKTTDTLEFVGARNSLCCFYKNGEFIKIKGTRKSIGYSLGRRRKEREFEEHIIKLSDLDSMYMFSDGYTDQLNQENIRIGSEGIEKILLELQNNSMEKQKEILLEKFIDHKGEEKQTDDITMMGIKF